MAGEVDARNLNLEQLESVVKEQPEEPVAGTVYTPAGDIRRPFIPPGPVKKVAAIKKPILPKIAAPKTFVPKPAPLPKPQPKPPKSPHEPREYPKIDIKIAVKPVLIGLSIVIVTMLALLGWRVLFTANEAASPIQNQAASKHVVPLIGKAIENDLRVYRKGAVYTLTDPVGQKIVEATASPELELVTPVGDSGFLFADNSVVPVAYSFLNRDGLRPLPDISLGLQNRIAQGEGQPIGIDGLNQTSIAYQYCNDLSQIERGRTVYKCDLRAYDIETGIETVVQLPPGLAEHQAKLLTLSSDKKSAYFIGMAKADRATFQKQVAKLGDTQKLYDLKINKVILQLDLKTQNITNSKAIKTQYTYYQKFWLSPDGRHLVYSNRGEVGQLHYVNVSKNSDEVIKLPQPDLSTEPWSGTTTTYDPVFSPNGKYMAYVTYDERYTNQLETMGVIEFGMKTAKEYSKQPNDGTGVKGFFNNLRWYGDQAFEVRQYRDNHRFTTATGASQKFDNKYGLLIGLRDAR